MQQSAEHVEYQLPNQCTHVEYLLEGIQCPNPGLQVAIASIHTDNELQGMHNNFEATAAHLLPYTPVIKKRADSTRCPAAQILALEGYNAEIADTVGKKPSIGISGVHLHYHMNLEHHELTAEQKRELCEWRETNPDFKCSKSGKNTMGKSKGHHNNKFPNSKRISSLVSKEIQKIVTKQDESHEGPDVDAYIAGMVQAAVAKMQTSQPVLASDSKITKKVPL